MAGMERKRKRKKVHNNNNNSNNNESSESEGDSENEQHKEFDNEYLDFLKDFFNPTQTASVSSMDINDDEEADPEYNIREDDLEDNDREELRRDRAVKISKKELNELLAELKTIEGFDLEGNDDDEQEQEDNTNQSVNISQDQSLQTPKKIDMIVSFENSNNNNDITTICTNTIKDITSTTTNTIATSPIPIETTNQSVNQKEKEQEEEEAFSPRTLGLIKYQIQQHIQQLAQTYVLTATCSEESMKKISTDSKAMIVDLSNRAEVAGPNSSFAVKNIKLAKDFINSWPVNVMFKSPIKKKILEERYMNENQIDKSDGKIYPRNIVKVIAENSLFMYPDLLPLSPTLQCPIKVNFTLSEDALIAVGLKEMENERYEGFKLRDKAKLVGSVLLPGRPMEQIFHRIKNARKVSKTDDAAAISACCLKKFFVEKSIPPSPISSWTLDLLDMEPTAPINHYKLPLVWSCLVKKLKCEYPFTEYLSTSRTKKRKIRHGSDKNSSSSILDISGNITSDISCTDSNDSNSTEGGGNEDLQNKNNMINPEISLNKSNKSIKNTKVGKSKKIPSANLLNTCDSMETERFPILNIHGETTAYILVPKLYVQQQKTSEQEKELDLSSTSLPSSLSPSSSTTTSPNVSSSTSSTTPTTLPNISSFTPRKKSKALIDTSQTNSNINSNNNILEKQKQQSISVLDSQKKIISNNNCSSSSSRDKIVSSSSSSVSSSSSSMPSLSINNERVSNQNNLYSISHSLESPLKNRENYLKVSLENKQKQQQQLLLLQKQQQITSDNNKNNGRSDINNCRQYNSARTWPYERKSLYEINETILKKLQNETLNNNNDDTSASVAEYEEETDEDTSFTTTTHDIIMSSPEVINLCTRDGFEENKVPIINKQQPDKVNSIKSPITSPSPTTSNSIISSCTASNNNVNSNSTPIKRLILKNMLLVKKEVIIDNDDSLHDSPLNTSANNDCEIILDNNNEDENIIMSNTSNNNNENNNKTNEYKFGNSNKTNSHMDNGNSSTTNTNNNSNSNNNSNRKSKTPTRIEKTTTSRGEANRTGGDGHDGDDDEDDEDDQRRRNHRKRKNNEPEDKKETDMDHKEENGDSDGDDEDNLNGENNLNAEHIEEDFNHSPPPSLRNDSPSTNCVTDSNKIETTKLEESDDLMSQKKKARKIKRSPVGSGSTSNSAIGNATANNTNISSGTSTSNAASSTKKRVTKYNTTEMQKLLDDADSEIDIEQIETAFAEEFWTKLQHAVDQNLYNTILQVFVDFGERNAPEQELFSKVKDMLKDFPELLLDFVTMVDPQSCETFDLFKDNSQIQAQIRFMHLLEKLSLHCPQLKTRILQRLRCLRDLEKVKENDVMEVVELYFQGNKVMSEAFKALFPTIFRPETNVRQEDFEEVNLDDDSGLKNEDGAPLIITTTAITTSAVEVINLPEEANVPATNSCPCDCHVDTKNVSTMYTTKAKHCQKCCLRFLPDGKVFLNSGRNMKQVNVSYVDTKEKAEQIIARKNCSDCFEPFKVPDSPKRKSTRKSITTTTPPPTSTTNTITSTTTPFSSVSSYNVTTNRTNRQPSSSSKMIDNVNNSDGIIKKQQQQQQCGMTVTSITLKSLKPIHVPESSPPPTTVPNITTMNVNKDISNISGKISSTNNSNTTLIPPHHSSEVVSTEKDKNDSGDLEDGEILDEDDDNDDLSGDGDVNNIKLKSVGDQVSNSNIQKDSSPPITATSNNNNMNTSNEQKSPANTTKKIPSSNTSSPSSSSSGSSPSSSSLRNKPSPKVPSVWTLEEDRAILITCQQEQSLEAAFERLKKVLPNRVLPAIRTRFSELMAILEKVKEGDREKSEDKA